MKSRASSHWNHSRELRVTSDSDLLFDVEVLPSSLKDAVEDVQLYWEVLRNGPAT